MDQIRGYCNRICNECEIFKVTQADDNRKRFAMAANFSKLFDQAFNPEDINCDGCTVEAGYTFIFARECPIRIKEIGK